MITGVADLSATAVEIHELRSHNSRRRAAFAQHANGCARGIYCGAPRYQTQRRHGIDLEVVSEDGDSIAESWQTYEAINCVRLHIPYQFLGKAIERDYLPTAFAISEFVGWPVYDEQKDEFLAPEATRIKSWWKFW